MSRINPQFILSNTTSKGETSINLMFYYGGGKRFFYSIGHKISPHMWDNQKMRAKTGKGVKLDDKARNKHGSINKDISDMIVRVDKIFDHYDEEKIIPSKQMIKIELDKWFKAKDVEGPMNFIEYAKRVIADSKSGERLTRRGKKISPVTIKGYETTLYHLEQFNTKKRYPMNFDNIDMKFYKAFIKYFHDDKKALNTIGKNIKNVKVFIKEAYRQGFTQNRIFENPDFAVIEELTDQIYLNMDELQKIFEHDFSEKPHLDRARDLLILGCFTGLRFSDLGTISKESITEDGNFIRLRMQKTGNLVVIPLHPLAKAILTKYDGSPPPIISNQKLNDYIKDVGEDVKIKEPVSTTITRAGVRVDKTTPKYKLITTHTARRSFATNMYLAGIERQKIMKITGHKTEASFLKYIRVSEEENAQLLLDHDFFKNTSPLKIAE